MTSLTIGSLAKAGGVGVETVRFYQRRGLIAEPERPDRKGVRRYGADDIRQLRFIRMAQKAGFTLTEIRELLVLDATEDRVRIQNAREEAGRIARREDCRARRGARCPGVFGRCVQGRLAWTLPDRRRL